MAGGMPPKKRSRKGSQARAWMSMSMVREAFVTSVAWTARSVSFHISQESTVPNSRRSESDGKGIFFKEKNSGANLKSVSSRHEKKQLFLTLKTVIWITNDLGIIAPVFYFLYKISDPDSNVEIRHVKIKANLRGTVIFSQLDEI